MGLDLTTVPASSQLNLAKEDIEVLARLRQNYPSHVLASLIDDNSVSSASPRGSVSSCSSGATASTRTSFSSAPSPSRHNHRPTASYTSSIPSICERSESPEMFQANVTVPLPHPLSRSVSEYSLRDHAARFRPVPSQQVPTWTPTYLCTYCSNGFETKVDWETHEWIFHERQAYWPCPELGCDAVFDSAPNFEMHHEAMHNCLGCKHSSEAVRLLPERKAWACGFDGCKAVFLDWNKRCKHVGAHYEGLARRHGINRETPDWTYSNIMRNLLRQPELRDPFKRFMIRCHGTSKSAWPKMEWQRDDTGELRRCLEYRDFQRGITELVQMAYRLGHPAHNAALQVMSRPPTPPSEEVSRNHSRMHSQSSMDTASFSQGSTPGSPQPRPVRAYLYERKSSLTTLPEWGPAPMPPPKDYNLSKSLPSSPPDASPPRTRGSSPVRAASLNSELQSGQTRAAPRKRMIAREADVKGTGCAALIQFLRQGPPDELGRNPPPIMGPPPRRNPPAIKTHTPVVEHRARRVPSPRPPTDAEQIHLESPALVSAVSPVSTLPSTRSPVAPPGSPVYSLSQSSLTVPDTSSLPPSPKSLTPYSASSLSLWPKPDTPASYTTPELALPLSSPSDVVTQTIILPSQPSPTGVPPSPMPDLTGMDWPLPPPTLQRPAESDLPTHQDRAELDPPPTFLRPATSYGESSKRSRHKPRSLRWVSISNLVESPVPSPGIDFGFCLTQPLDLLQPVRYVQPTST